MFSPVCLNRFFAFEISGSRTGYGLNQICHGGALNISFSFSTQRNTFKDASVTSQCTSGDYGGPPRVSPALVSLDADSK